MRKGIASVILVMPLLAAVMLFNACPLPGNKSQGVQQYQKPFWAVNKPGTIELVVEGIDLPIEYDPNTTYSVDYTLKAISTIFTGEESKYKVYYEIVDSFRYVGTGFVDVEQAEYSGGDLSPTENDIGTFKLIIPKGYQLLQNVKLTIKYNITNLMTKIGIPMDIEKPPAGQSSIIEVPVFYSASPIIPKTDKARIVVQSRTVIVSFNLTDAVGCLSGYRTSPYIGYRAELYGGLVGEEKRKIENALSCTPSNIQLPSNAQIKCTIYLDRDQDIYKIFSSGSSVHLELYIYLGPYNCSLEKEKKIPVTIIT